MKFVVFLHYSVWCLYKVIYLCSFAVFVPPSLPLLDQCRMHIIIFIYEITKIVRTLLLVVFASEYVNMVVVSRCIGFHVQIMQA